MWVQAFAENVLVCGGGSAVTGLGAAVVAEMQSVSTPSLQPALCNCPDYMPEHTLKHSSWMGAAILSKVTMTTVNDCKMIGMQGIAYVQIETCYHLKLPALCIALPLRGCCVMQMVFQQNQHVTKLDYDEAGPAVVHKKCS